MPYKNEMHVKRIIDVFPEKVTFEATTPVGVLKEFGNSQGVLALEDSFKQLNGNLITFLQTVHENFLALAQQTHENVIAFLQSPPPSPFEGFR